MTNEKEQKIVMKFWETYKKIIKSFHVEAKEDHLNFLTFLQIVEDSYFDPSKYKTLFKNIPEYAQESILNFLNTDRDNFLGRFKKAVIDYRQEMKRVGEEE